MGIFRALQEINCAKQRMEMELRVHSLGDMSKYNRRKCKEMEDVCCVRQGNPFGSEKYRRKCTTQSDSEEERTQSDWKHENLKESNRNSKVSVVIVGLCVNRLSENEGIFWSKRWKCSENEVRPLKG